MTETTTTIRETTMEQPVEPHETVEKDYQTGTPHGDEEAGGAVGGAAVGPIVAGPAARSDGAASGATERSTRRPRTTPPSSRARVRRS